MGLSFLRDLLLTILVFFTFAAEAQVGGSSLPALIRPVTAKAGLVNRNKTESKPGPESQRGPAQVDEVYPDELDGPPQTICKEVSKPVRAPSLQEEATGLIGPGADKILEFYKEQTHEDDIRNNKMEIQGGLGLVYNASGANYSFRNYSTTLSAMDLSANVWMMPSIGVVGRILFSFGASMPGDPTTSSRMPAKYEDVDLGVKFRRYFGLSQLANSVNFDFLYSDWKLITPSDNNFRPKLHSRGFGMRLSTRIPTSESYAWVFGGTLYPRVAHNEDTVGTAISSGTPAESVRVGLNIGGEIKFSRSDQIIFDLSASSERDTFTGTASPVDSETGVSPSNVSVTNTLVMFTFGYRWGR